MARGRGCEAAGTIAGELVFNAAMTGYQEALTDPSYAGQLLMFTFPQIGNYGFAAHRNESAGPQVRGCLVREWCRAPHQGRDTLDTWLARHGVVSLEGVETRALTVRTREAGLGVETVWRISEQRQPDALGLMRQGNVNLIINLPAGPTAAKDAAQMRRLAVELGIPFITTLAGAQAATEALGSPETETVASLNPPSVGITTSFRD